MMSLPLNAIQMCEVTFFPQDANSEIKPKQKKKKL